jgi:hypothetical protein
MRTPPPAWKKSWPTYANSTRDAVPFSVGANAAHGLGRSNADKRWAVEMLLADADWVAWSIVAVAKACGVSYPLIGELRRPIIEPFDDIATLAICTAYCWRLLVIRHFFINAFKGAPCGWRKPNRCADPAIQS